MEKLDSKTQQIVDFMHEGHSPSAIDRAMELESGFTHDLWLDFILSNRGVLPPKSQNYEGQSEREVEEMRAQIKAIKQTGANGYECKRAQQFNRVVARRYAGRSVRRVDVWSA